MESTYNYFSMVTNVSPGMVVFGRDMIFNFQMQINWQQIAQKRNKLARMDNARENNKRLS